MKTLKKEVSHWPLTLLGSASSLFNLFLPVVMSRRLSQDGVGEFKVFFLYLAAVPALSLGIGFTNGTYLWGADPKEGKAKTRAALLLAILSGLGATAVVFVSGFARGFTPSLLLFAAACAPAVASSIFEASLVAAGKVRQAAAFSASFEFVRLASFLGAMLLGASVTTIFILQALISWAKLFASIYGLGLPSPQEQAFQKIRAPLLRYAVPVSVAAIFDLLVLNADRYVLAALLAASDFAIYAFGCLMVPPLFVFEQAVNQVLIPKLALAKVGGRKAPALLRGAVEDLLLILVPASAGLIALADPLIRFLFTNAYSEAAVFLSWYALYYTLSAFPQDVLARARGDSGWILRVSIVFGLVALACTALAAHFFGALGALQAFLLVQAFRRIYAFVYFAKEEQCSFSEMLPWLSALVFIGSAVAAGWLAHYVASLQKIPSHAFLLGSAAFVPVYFGLVYALRKRAFIRVLKFRSQR